MVCVAGFVARCVVVGSAGGNNRPLLPQANTLTVVPDCRRPLNLSDASTNTQTFQNGKYTNHFSNVWQPCNNCRLYMTDKALPWLPTKWSMFPFFWCLPIYSSCHLLSWHWTLFQLWSCWWDSICTLSIEWDHPNSARVSGSCHAKTNLAFCCSKKSFIFLNLEIAYICVSSCLFCNITRKRWQLR